MERSCKGQIFGAGGRPTRQQSPLGLIRGRGRPHPFWLSGMLCSRYGYLPYLRLKKFGRYKFGDFCYNFCCTFVLLGPWFSSSERSCYISFNTVLTCFLFFLVHFRYKRPSLTSADAPYCTNTANTSTS